MLRCAFRQEEGEDKTREKLVLMGEEQKQEEKKGEGEKKEEEKKEEEKKEEEQPPDIVLRVDMHCEGCAKKVARALRGFEGVEEVMIDSKARKVVVKGKAADPVKVCERVQRKTGRKTEIISPLPKPPEEEKKEEAKDTPPPEEKKEEPKPITVILKIRMHCEACAQVLQKRIKKMEGVDSVVTELANNQIIVKGIFDSEKLVHAVYRKTKRQASIVKDEEQKNEEQQEKKEEKNEGEKKNEEEKAQDENNVIDLKKYEYWPPRYFVEYSYYSPPPQIFSDENPNACSAM